MLSTVMVSFFDALLLLYSLLITIHHNLLICACWWVVKLSRENRKGKALGLVVFVNMGGEWTGFFVYAD